MWLTRMQFFRLALEFECEDFSKYPTQGNTVYVLSKDCQGLTAIKAEFERLSSVILCPDSVLFRKSSNLAKLLIHKTSKEQEKT